jgi:hypothetical protein
MVGKWLVEELLLQPYHQLLKKWLVDSRAGGDEEEVCYGGVMLMSGLNSGLCDWVKFLVLPFGVSFAVILQWARCSVKAVCDGR